MIKKSEQAIGVFDSGLGGLTVVKEILRQLPNEKIVYLGDTAHVPYGNKSAEHVTKLSRSIVKFLMEKKVKFIIVACNTASSVALKQLRKEFASVPILGVIEPGTRAAVRETRKKVVGVIGTIGTVNSGSYTNAIKRSDSKIKVYSLPCPLFVPLVEEGWVNKKVTYEIAKEYLVPLKKKNVDVLILGCTHYPLLKKVIQDTVGNQVKLIDSAEETVRETKQLLNRMGLLRNKSKSLSEHWFFVTDSPEKFRMSGKRFLNKNITSVKQIDIDGYF